jgi:AraC family transcriptional regulator
MQQMILALKHELTCGNPCGLLYPETIAQMLALHLLSKHCTFNRKTPEFKGGLTKNQLRCILDYLQSHWNQDISLDSMALLLGISSYHFLRQFKKSMGESPLQYLIRLRMEAAKRLLAQSHLSITEIAFEVGYDGISHFIHLFKRHTGTTPAAYRKSL